MNGPLRHSCAQPTSEREIKLSVVALPVPNDLVAAAVRCATEMGVLSTATVVDTAGRVVAVDGWTDGRMDGALLSVHRRQCRESPHVVGAAARRR